VSQPATRAASARRKYSDRSPPSWFTTRSRKPSRSPTTRRSAWWPTSGRRPRFVMRASRELRAGTVWSTRRWCANCARLRATSNRASPRRCHLERRILHEQNTTIPIEPAPLPVSAGRVSEHRDARESVEQLREAAERSPAEVDRKEPSPRPAPRDARIAVAAEQVGSPQCHHSMTPTPIAGLAIESAGKMSNGTGAAPANRKTSAASRMNATTSVSRRSASPGRRLAERD